MKSKECQYIPKSRRGLSTIVGALLFVVLMVATFSVLGIALNSQTDIVQTSRDVTDLGLARQQEDFDLISINQQFGNFLEVNLKNQGQNAAEMFTMIMTNKSVAGEPTQTFSIPSDTSFLAPGAELPTDIVETLNLNMTIPAVGIVETYDFKVISSLGTIKKLSIDCNGDTGVCGPITGPIGTGALSSSLFLDGPTGINGKTSTVIMFYQNTGDEIVYDVEPIKDCATMTTEPLGPPVGTFDPCVLTPAIPISSLAPDAVGIFKWDGVVGCQVGQVFSFLNGVKGNDSPGGTPITPSDEGLPDTLDCIDPNDCGPGGCGPGGDPGQFLIILDDLLIRPSIFLTIPSPFGTGGSLNDLGLWGLNIANPTNSTMDVSKVTITAFAPGANDNVKVFDMASGNHQTVFPTGVGLGDWKIGKTFFENIAIWDNFDDPITLGPYTNGVFMFKAKPDDTTKQFESIIVQASVFTTSGSFGKAGYQTTMFGSTGSQGDSPIANIYLSNVTDSRANINIKSDRMLIKNGTAQNFSIVLADMDEDDDTAIVNGSKIVINVPREWTNVSIIPGNTTNVYQIPNADPELAEPSIKFHGDGSYQIIATTNTPLGNGTGVGANPNTATVSFTATSPEKTSESMYIMYVLGYGQTEELRSVGPLSEIVLHVIGNVTGYP